MLSKERYKAAYVYWLCCIATLGGVMFGFSTGVISGSVELIQQYFHLSPAETGWIVSSIFVGCVLGALAAGKLADRIGRKSTLLLSTLAFAISAYGTTFADSFAIFSSARIVAGIGIGLASTVVPLYMGEIAPRDIRGKASGIWDLSLLGSQTLVFLVNFLIGKGMTEAWLVEVGWRWMMGAQFVPVALMLVCTLILPESPTWCIDTRRVERAIKVLSKIYPDLNHEEARQFFSARETAGGSLGLGVILRTPVLRYGLIVGCAIGVLQQFTGAAIVMYYAPVILQTGDMSKDALLFQTIFIGLFTGIASFVGMTLFDRFGRRPVMKFGTIGSIVGLLLISYSMYTHHSGYLSIFAALFFMAMFGISWSAGCWVLLSEIFPPRIRSHATGLAVTLMWAFNFLVTQFFPMINEIPVLQESFNGAFTMWIFVAFNLFCLFFLIRYLPETRGVALDDMEALIESHRRKLSRKTGETRTSIAVSDI
ncbi:sugar transporter [Azotobacter vinelandii CA]|uniref:Sugar transporter n=2 Tax=Azotobacter vinelandii TaxID=354 RepID=C1DPU8_AZOVD|nr:sugar porter family MFS transporter [Azotobacter vinelandii]ACO79519.1 sugar transporter [Azotobacter vinelandii DJ]AGK16342.1 sugar transporter [Azotobacter vinelandii CA]AGK21290.1 sugar transporter [Azotobacter vinelandii CA6]WKN20405.1 sugar porter family MFS transporter [Azotobacter vinelandii]SFX26526.1 MFS transporter, sugar porter (SP) family [Azotobacter vinelandii]